MCSRVMVIDDSEADQFLCDYTLRKFNPEIEISTAFDGIEALEVLAKLDQHPEVIFLDINMPRMNGYEFLKAYEAAYSKDSAALVVMLTSSDQSQDKIFAEKSEFVSEYLTKPLRTDCLDEICSGLHHS